jgi:hypothetical protein
MLKSIYAIKIGPILKRKGSMRYENRMSENMSEIKDLLNKM